MNVTNENCTGCRACVNICPVGCIKMKHDKEGFLIPEVDMNMCIGCKSCIRTCPLYNEVKKTSPIRCYAAVNKDIEVLKCSSSGGG